MLRTIWISKQHWLKPGPMTYMGLLNARAFAENGIKTEFFVRAEKHYDVANTGQDLSAFYGLPDHPNFTVHCVPETHSWKRDVYKDAVAKILAYHDEGDEIIAATREYGALAMLLKLKQRCSRLKVLFESHNFFINLKHLDSRPWSFPRWRTRWAERHQLVKADGLICLTEHQRALYQHWFPQLPTIALPLGCLDFPMHPDIEQRRSLRRVAYIGHLYDYKGLELFFQLAQSLKPLNIQLHIFGGYPDEVTALQQRANQEGLAEVLFFKAFIEPKALHEILQNDISLGLVPLQDTYYNRYLTCPVKVLDFMAHGLPIAASELPSIRDLLREAGNYCDSHKVTEFAAQIQHLLDDKDAYARVSQATYQRARELQWPMRAQRLVEFTGALSRFTLSS
jgi:glycosyltransferase involved in cell wall biosynthesis